MGRLEEDNYVETAETLPADKAYGIATPPRLGGLCGSAVKYLVYTLSVYNDNMSASIVLEQLARIRLV